MVCGRSRPVRPRARQFVIPCLQGHEMARDDRLKALFRAFGGRDEGAFRRVAEAIIAEELAANHHGLATELKRSLDNSERAAGRRAQRNQLTFLPKERRNGETLVALQESSVDESRIVLRDETRRKVQRILDEHRRRLDLAEHGYRPKSLVLFWGPPGCGKTHTAFHVAYELGLPVGVLRLSSVISSFLGDTASNLQRVFELANSTPMVLLLDEVDAVGKNRDDPNDVGELKRVVNSLLQAVDFFHSEHSVVIAASNHQYLLDPALWRRFDDVVCFPMPGRGQRETYLRLLLGGVQFEGSLANIARSFSALSYSDIERVTVEAVKTMLLEERDVVRSSDLLEQARSFRQSINAAKGRPRGG